MLSTLIILLALLTPGQAVNVNNNVIGDMAAYMDIMDKGGTINYHDTIISGLGFSKQIYTAENPLIVGGNGTSVLYAFKGEYKPYDPSIPPPRIWGGLSIMDCQHIIVRGWKIMGGIENTLSINNSYPEEGHKCAHITIEDCEISLGETRGLFGAGKVMHDITFRRCVFKETIYSGNATHSAYMSGGAWNPKYPPIQNITFENCTFALTGGRHGLQFNGRFKGIKIIGCKFFHNQLSGLSIIGGQDILVSRCIFWGNGRAAIVIYDDAFDSSYWNPDFRLPPGQDIMTKKDGKWSFEHWVATHHPNGNIKIEYCTMLTGPTAWVKDPWHTNDPTQFPVIQVNNAVHGKWFGGQKMHYPPGPITIDHCIMESQKQVAIEFSNNEEALMTRVTNSIIWASKGATGISAPAGWFSIEKLQKNFGGWYEGNEVRDPHISVEPYPLIDRSVDPTYYWGPRFAVGAAEKLRAGKMVDKVYGRYGVKMQGRNGEMKPNTEPLKVMRGKEAEQWLDGLGHRVPRNLKGEDKK